MTKLDELFGPEGSEVGDARLDLSSVFRKESRRVVEDVSAAPFVGDTDGELDESEFVVGGDDGGGDYGSIQNGRLKEPTSFDIPEDNAPEANMLDDVLSDVSSQFNPLKDVAGDELSNISRFGDPGVGVEMDEQTMRRIIRKIMKAV